jgi:hypothetical protein
MTSTCPLASDAPPLSLPTVALVPVYMCVHIPHAMLGLPWLAAHHSRLSTHIYGCLPPLPPRYRMSTEDVPVGEFTLPLGQAAVVREGSDITLVGWGAQVRGAGGEGGVGM